MEEDKLTYAPYLKSLDSCRKGIIANGYTERFLKNAAGFISTGTNRHYHKQQVNIISQIRFEGNRDNERVDLYLIETADGTKGTFIQPHRGIAI